MVLDECDVISDINCQIVYNFCKSIYTNFIPIYEDNINKLDYSLIYIQQIDNWSNFCNTTLNEYYVKGDYFINTDKIPDSELTIFQETSDYATKIGFFFQNIIILFLLLTVIKTHNKIQEKAIVHLIQFISASAICYWAWYHNNLTFFVGNAGLLIFELILSIYLIRFKIKEYETKRILDCNDILNS